MPLLFGSYAQSFELMAALMLPRTCRLSALYSVLATRRQPVPVLPDPL